MKKNSFCNFISIFNIYHIWRIGQDELCGEATQTTGLQASSV